ncbi:MAG TPA: HPr(Ser) kinase/phosphatase [Pyrinomonadaceae bacterium]|nr:HPr(Ser) kinase/phosphatase [Pyrinomonadaceae bacterium]
MQAANLNANPKISVAEFVKKSPAEMELKVLAGEKGLAKREISSTRIQKLGLALAGFSHYIHAGRIQIVGQSEITYLLQLEREKRIAAIHNLELEKICCILITKNLEPPRELLEIAQKENLPVLRTPLISSKTIRIVSDFLQELLAPQTTIHGVLMGMYGLGILILGESGIGKSECALDLITRRHRLISDDTVIVKKIGDDLIGSSHDLTAEHLEIRGLGILNVRDLFGVSAVGRSKRINLCIELKKWSEVLEVERLGIEMRQEEILEVKIPKFVLPVSSGRNLSTLVETAVRVYLLKVSGYDAAQKLIEKHTAAISGENK